jgi:hypothetical protein
MEKIRKAFGLIDGGIDREMEGRVLDAELEAEMRFLFQLGIIRVRFFK